MKSRIVYIFLWVCLIGLTYEEDACPEQCQCTRGKWSCGSQNITNLILLDVVKMGDPNNAKELILKNNLITEFPTLNFASFTQLKTLNLGKNLMTKPPKNISEHIPSLRKLFLNSNKISSVSKEDFKGYDNVNYLDLYGNNISEIHPNVFDHLPELTQLFAEGNNLKVLENGIFAGRAKLIWVTFQGNQIERIDPDVFNDTTSLERVWLNDNKLKSLPKGLFKNSKEIFILDLKMNQLVDEGIPKGSLSAEEIILSSNNLTTLKKEWFSGPIKYEVDVTNNSIHCDCALYDTYRFLNKKNEGPAVKVKGYCFSPPKHKGEDLEEVLPKNLVNCTACSLNQCQNNATCHVADADTSYTCNCTDKYYGERCHRENFCRLSPCTNNGTCSNTNTTFVCACKPGFIGEKCEVEQPCFFTNPCRNNGTCSYVNGTLNHFCTCVDGFTGLNCQIVQDDKDDSLKPGYIVLIVLVVLAFVAVLVVYLYLRRKKTGGKATLPEASPLSGGVNA